MRVRGTHYASCITQCAFLHIHVRLNLAVRITHYVLHIRYYVARCNTRVGIVLRILISGWRCRRRISRSSLCGCARICSSWACRSRRRRRTRRRRRRCRRSGIRIASRRRIIGVRVFALVFVVIFVVVVVAVVRGRNISRRMRTRSTRIRIVGSNICVCSHTNNMVGVCCLVCTYMRARSNVRIRIRIRMRTINVYIALLRSSYFIRNVSRTRIRLMRRRRGRRIRIMGGSVRCCVTIYSQLVWCSYSL